MPARSAMYPLNSKLDEGIKLMHKAYYREYFGFRIQGFLPDHHEAVGQVEHEEDDAPGCSSYVGPEIIFDFNV